jgi:hypothetical protein
MNLPTPLLDDASFETLSRQLRQRIPVLTPEWTDWNPSDPGIALLDLVAHAAEGLLWRFNQIPEATQLAFLRLLGLPLRPPTAARVLLAFTSKHRSGALETLAQDLPARAGAVAFALERETPVWPGEALALLRQRTAAPAPEERELGESLRPTLAALAPRHASGTAPAFYDVAMLDGQAAQDPALAVDGCVWVAWLAPEKPGEAPPAWQRGSRFTLGWWPAAETRDPQDDELARAEACPGLGAARAPRTLEWRVLAHDLVGGRADWRPVAVKGDDTDGGSRAGVIELELPAAPEDLLPPLVPAGLEGTEDFPPPLPPALAGRVRLWLKAWPTPPAAGQPRTLPPLQRVAANAAWALQALPRGAEYLGRGDGQPQQRYRLGSAPVLADAVQHPVLVEVEEAGVWVPWQHVNTLDLSGADDRHARIDGASGELQFGLRGPQLGERVRVAGYRVGGGAAGNVGAGAVTRCDNTQVAVNNPEPARGGRDAEALEAALQRVPAEVTRRDRAVTAEDFRALAEATPGAEIARAEVLPLFDPRTRSFERAGAVSVIVWPEADVALVPAPVPAASQRTAVCAWLDARRLVGTELFVLAPSYRRIAVSCAVAVEPGFGPEAARSLAAQILQRYVAPLPPDGPLGRGWPLGRAVRDRELIAAVLQVDGIEYVEALRLAVWQEGAWVEQATVTLQPWEVVELAAVQVVEASQPLPAPQDAVAPPPAAPAVAVPVIRDLCG